MNSINSIDNKNNKTSSRLSALDLARCFAMVMMIQGHTIFELTKPELINVQNFPWSLWEFMRGLTAPMFLIVSGIVNVFANKRDENGRLPSDTVSHRLRMAFMLLFFGYFLFFPADKIFHLAFIQPQVWKPFFAVNILQCIGFSIIFLILIFKITRSDKGLAIASIVISLLITGLNPIVHQMNWFSYMPEPLADYISMERGSVFTIFPFTGFLFYGVAFGTFLKRAEPEKRNSYIIKHGIITGLILIFAGIPIYYLIQSMNLHFVDYLKVNSGMMLIRAGFVFLFLAAITWIYTKTTKYGKIYSIFGKRALFIYIVHLIILYGLPWFHSIAQIYHYVLPLTISIPVALSVEILAFASAYYYETKIDRNIKYKPLFRYSLIFLIIFLLFV